MPETNSPTGPANGHTLTSEDKKKGAATTNAIRHNPTLDIVEMQRVLKKIVSGAVRYQVDVGQVIDIPAREIAQAAVAFTKLENQRRMNLGKANPAPIKSDGKAKSRSRSGLVPPAPRVAEPEPPKV